MRTIPTLGAATLLGVSGLMTIGAPHASAQTGVGDEEALRSALAVPHPGEIVLAADIDLTDCELGGLTSAPESDVIIRSDGSGPHTITQTCEGERVLRILAAGGSTATLTVDNVVLTGGNFIPGGSSDAGDGGAILSSGDVAVARSILRHNDARIGGAISALGHVTVTDSTFHDNESSFGGAINVLGDITVTGSTFHDNAAVFGGGIHAGQDVTVTASTFRDNTAGSGGGALSSVGAALVTVSGSTFSGNHATFGGGIYVRLGGFDATNITVTGNSAEREGGGIHIGNEPSVLRHATVVANEAPDGANLSMRSTNAVLRPFGSVVALPIGGENCSTFGSNATVESQGYNVTDDGSCDLTAATDTTGGDPRLGDLADNGGPTPTRLPAADSPLLDAIPVDDCHPDVTTDQRGIDRPKGPRCDTGAVEVEVEVPTTLQANRARYGLLLSSVTVSARLTETDSETPIAGQRITFRTGRTPLCAAETNADGRARCTAGAIEALAVVLNGSYHASFAGDDPYLPSTATGAA